MDTNNIIELLENLVNRVNSIEQSLKEKNDASIQVHIDIKEFNLKEFTLDELAFHLDKLDIQELSGMLNLGNTFSPKILSKDQTKNLSNKELGAIPIKAKKSSDDIQVHINGKPVPYSITKEKGDPVE